MRLRSLLWGVGGGGGGGRERAVSFGGKLVFGQTVRAGRKYTTHTEITSPLAAVWRKAAPFDSVTHRYVGQAWVLQLFCDTAGFPPIALHSLSATVCQLSSLPPWHVTARVFWPVPHSLLHLLHAVLTHLEAHLFASLHALLFAGSVFVALVVQNESATLVTFEPCVDWHELPVRTWMPPPQALEHAP